jgi:hypothetical protein
VTPFEHLTVLVSIVIGMGITHLLITARELVQVRSRVKLYWLPMLWFVPIFIALVERWWAIFALHSTIKWNFFYFLFYAHEPCGAAQRRTCTLLSSRAQRGTCSFFPSVMAPDLRIRLKRHGDGSASLTLTRADGSVTWQRQNGSLGVVFPPHDLTHFAIESELHFRSGFYGLVADGWEISDFAAPWPRGAIPAEAREVELIVGFFDSERRSMDRWDAAAFNEHAEKFVAAGKYAGKIKVPVLRDEDIARVRAVRDHLLQRWHALPPGDSMELEFRRAWPPLSS